MTRHLYTSDRGYEVLREPGVDGLDSRVYHHRLLAYAWGLIDSMDDDAHVHHRVECPFLNIESNLIPTEPTDHGRITRQRERNRTEFPEAEHPAVSEVFSA